MEEDSNYLELVIGLKKICEIDFNFYVSNINKYSNRTITGITIENTISLKDLRVYFPSRFI